MSDLDRWTSDGATDAEAKLLALARGDGPSSASRARIAAGIGIGATFGSMTPAAAKASFSIAKWIAGKWVMIAAIGTVTAVGGWQIQRASTSLVATPPPQTTTSATQSPGPPPAAQPQPEPQPEPPATAQAEPPRAPALATPPQAKRLGAPAIASSSVEAELALLESAKESINRHQPNAALATVADYEQRHPGGLLGLEASVIRIEALAQAKRIPETRSAANAFLRAHPHAVQAARIRSLLHEIDATP